MSNSRVSLWLSAVTGFCAGLLGGVLSKSVQPSDLPFVVGEGDDRSVDLGRVAEELHALVEKVQSLQG